MSNKALSIIYLCLACLTAFFSGCDTAPEFWRGDGGIPPSGDTDGDTDGDSDEDGD